MAGCAAHVPGPGLSPLSLEASLLITVHGGQTLTLALDELEVEARDSERAAAGALRPIALVPRSAIAVQGSTTTTVKLSGLGRRAELFDAARELARLNPERHVWLVLYEPGTLRSPATRRLLSRTVAIEVSADTEPVPAQEASSVRWMEASDAVAALELAEALRGPPDFVFALPTLQAPPRIRVSLVRKQKAASQIPPRQDLPEERQAFFALKRAPLGFDAVPAERYLAAREALRDMPQHSTAAGGLSLPSQTALGTTTSAAAALALGTWTPLGPGNIGGRTRAVLFDPLTPTTMYAGGVAGGVWKSTNGGASWTPLTDSMANLAVGSLAMDPANSSVIYAGTGEGYFNGDSVRGAGIFKTTNAGATWARLANTNAASFHFVNKIVVSPNSSSRVYAATRIGIFRSVDAGATWSQVLNPGAVNGCLDLVIRSDQSTDSMLAACGTFVQSTIYRNPDAGGGGSWTAVLGAAQGETAMARTSLAIAPSNQNVMYALSASNASSGNFQDGGLHAVFRSTDGGLTWTARVRNTSGTKLNTVLLTNPVFAFYADCGFTPPDANQYFNQGWYDNVIAVDPADANRVWAGGIDLFRSDDGGANWGMASHWWASTSNPRYAHADQHVIVFHPGYNGTTNKTMLVGSDGGLFRTADARATTATGATAPCSTNNGSVNWAALNHGYAVTQFYHGLAYPAGTTYFGGTQDNGTVRGSDGAGQNAWSAIKGGDGGYVAVDRGNPNVLYGEFTFLSIEKSVDGGSSWASAVGGITESSDNFQFINPFAMDPSNAQRLWTGGSFMWRTVNGTGSWTQASSTLCGSLSGVTALAVAPTNPNRVLSGMSGGCINRTASGLTATGGTAWSSSQPAGGYVSWLAFDPTNDNIAYATYSTFGVPHVWKSTNGGATWASIDGSGTTGVPDIPVHSLVVDPVNTARLYIGTDLGVLVSRDGGATWAVEVSGFANVITEALAIENVGATPHIFAFTHGRGAWRVPAADVGTPPTVTTGAATGVGPTGATLNGIVNPNGSATTAFFAYGLTTFYGSQTANQSLGTGTGPVPFSAAVAGLQCGRLYHFRAVASNAAGATNGADQSFTTPGCRSTLGDFDGDGKRDLAVYRPTTGEWFIFGSATGFQSQVFGAPSSSGLGDTPVPADFDGDGKTDLAIYRQATSEWFIFGSASGFQTRTFGAPASSGLGDTPVPADFDGDGNADLAIYRKATGDWFIFGSATGFQTRTFGAPASSGLGDVPVPADFDGDGTTDLAIYRKATGEWFIFGSATGFQTQTFGAPASSGLGDTPVPADFDGDGKADLAVYRKTTGEWFILGSTSGFRTLSFGAPAGSGLGDTPVPGDFDGDGNADVAVQRSATAEWFVLQSVNGQLRTDTFGAPSDLPVPQPAQ